MREYTYDLEDVDIASCDNLVISVMPIAAIPTVMGALQSITWRRRHVSDESHQVGLELYQELQEIFIMNSCIVDKLEELRTMFDDKLSYLSCICDYVTQSLQSDNRYTHTVIVNELEGNTDVDFNDDNLNPDLSIPVPGDYSTDRCQRAQATFDNIMNVAMGALEIQLGVGAVSSSAIVGLISALATLTLPVSIVVGLIGGITYILVSGAMKWHVEGFTAQRQNVVCALYNSETMIDAQAAIADIIDGYTDNLAARQWLKVFFKSATMAHFWLNSDNIPAYDGNACWDCTGVPTGLYFWPGSPCSTSELLGYCGSNDCIRVNVPNPADTPSFQITAAGTYRVSFRISNSTVTGQIRAALNQEFSPPGTVAWTDIDVPLGVTVDHEWDVAMQVGSYHIDMRNVNGAADGDIEYVSIAEVL